MNAQLEGVNKLQEVLKVGIVVAIDKVGKTFSVNSPIGSCRIRLIGQQTVKTEDIGYYTPLFPPNLIMLPNEGEAVYVMFMGTNSSGNGFYFTRKASIESYVEFGDALKSASTEEGQYAGPKPKILPRDSKNVKNDTKKVYKSGDIALNGNPGNGILLSYDNVGKPLVDIYTTASGSRNDGVYSYTKSSVRVVLSESNLDKVFNPKATISNNTDKSNTFIISENTRIWNPESGNLNPAVLGTKQSEWLSTYIDLNKKFMDEVISSIDFLSNHKHTHPYGPTILVIAPTALKTASSNLTKLKDEIDAHTKKISEHHSTSLLLN